MCKGPVTEPAKVRRADSGGLWAFYGRFDDETHVHKQRNPDQYDGDENAFAARFLVGGRRIVIGNHE
jgi:hypothetical protein